MGRVCRTSSLLPSSDSPGQACVSVRIEIRALVGDRNPGQRAGLDAELPDVRYIPDRVLMSRPHHRLRSDDRIFVEAHDESVAIVGRRFDLRNSSDHECSPVVFRRGGLQACASSMETAVPSTHDVGVLLRSRRVKNPGSRTAILEHRPQGVTREYNQCTFRHRHAPWPATYRPKNTYQRSAITGETAYTNALAVHTTRPRITGSSGNATASYAGLSSAIHRPPSSPFAARNTEICPSRRRVRQRSTRIELPAGSVGSMVSPCTRSTAHWAW